MKRITLVLLSFYFLSLGTVHAWRETGHFTVCEIAMRHIKSQTKEAMKTILGDEVFAEQCTWPDQVRKSDDHSHTYPWHFINLDDNKDYYQNINPRGDIIFALITNQDILMSSTATPNDKKQALKFLGHFVGDIHQPLHVGRSRDLGGNRIYVSWFGESEYDYEEILVGGITIKNKRINLHKVIDLHLIEKFIQINNLKDEGNKYAYKAYANLINTATEDDAKNWKDSIFTDWMEESLALRDEFYNVGDKKLGEAYYSQNIRTLNQRILQAGVRLAGTLDQIFTGNGQLTEKEKAMREKIAQARR